MSDPTKKQPDSAKHGRWDPKKKSDSGNSPPDERTKGGPNVEKPEASMEDEDFNAQATEQPDHGTPHDGPGRPGDQKPL
jgi:hypothetical protein